MEEKRTRQDLNLHLHTIIYVFFLLKLLVRDEFIRIFNPFVNGVPEEIRTPDSGLRRTVLYPTELQAHKEACKFITLTGQEENVVPPYHYGQDSILPQNIGTKGGTRTLTEETLQQILSLSCLPFHHSGLVLVKRPSTYLINHYIKVFFRKTFNPIISNLFNQVNSIFLITT